MAGEIFTFPVAEISIVLIFPILITHEKTPCKKGIYFIHRNRKKKAHPTDTLNKAQLPAPKNVLPVPAEAPYAPTYLTYLSLRKVSQ